MKRFIMLCSVLTAAGLAVLAAVMAVLPDQIPMHWNAQGVMDRMGSKYELLLIVLMGIATAAFVLWAGARKAEDAMTQRVTGWSAVFCLVLFFGITLFTIYAGIQYTRSGGTPSPGTAQLVMKGSCIIAGLSLTVLGNFMPKARLNSLFGIRVPWTMNSHTVWQRSQRTGGITAVVAGLLILLLAVLLPGLPALLAMLVICTLWVIIALGASWKYHREEELQK